MLASGAPAAAAFALGRRQPTFMLCRRELRPDLERYLAAGGRKFDAWLSAVGTCDVPFADAAAFANINTPEELERLEKTACG